MISMIYLKTTGIITLLNKIFFDQGDCCHSMENRKATTQVAATVWIIREHTVSVNSGISGADCIQCLQKIGKNSLNQNKQELNGIILTY